MVNFLQLILGILVIVFYFLRDETWVKWALLVVGILIVLVSLFEKSRPAR